MEAVIPTKICPLCESTVDKITFIAHIARRHIRNYAVLWACHNGAELVYSCVCPICGTANASGDHFWEHGDEEWVLWHLGKQ